MTGKTEIGEDDPWFAPMAFSTMSLCGSTASTRQIDALSVVALCTR